MSFSTPPFHISGAIRMQDGLTLPNGNLIEGNYIGTDVTGTLFLGGSVVIVNGSHETLGGTTAGARNVLMGLSIEVSGPTKGELPCRYPASTACAPPRFLSLQSVPLQ